MASRRSSMVSGSTRMRLTARVPWRPLFMIRACSAASTSGRAERQSRSSRASSLFESAKAEVFDFEEVIDAIVRTFASKSRLFDSAERGHFVGDESCVDANHPAFQRLRRPPDAADVTAVKIAGETEFGVVGHGNALLVAFETEERSQWPERLFLRDFHLGCYIAQDGWLEKCPTKGMPLASEQHMAPLRDGILNVVLNLFDSGKVDQRALLHFRLKAVADLELGDGGNEFLCEGIVDAGLDIQPVRADAGLSGIPVLWK